MVQSSQLILNPVENLPLYVADRSYECVHGLYVSDKEKTDEAMKSSKIAFSGRTELNQKVRQIYSEWACSLNVKNLSMRLLSGLHAHIVLFMGLGAIGETVMLLPEVAGGHYATKGILTRLGYRVVDMVPDCDRYCVDVDKTLSVMKQEKPSYLFVDRSEGIQYENYSSLLSETPDSVYCVFDASQYLTNILCGDFTSPFDMGFDLMMATLHKNFPGPQKALVCSKYDSPEWDRVLAATSSYVSSLHIETTLLAGEVLDHGDLLRQYSSLMLDNSVRLEQELLRLGLPVVPKDASLTPTHHIWLRIDDEARAFSFFKAMESCSLLVNYRKLPYKLGMGIRMGTSAATLQGLNANNVPALAQLISDVYRYGDQAKCIRASEEFIRELTPLKQTIEQRTDSR